MFILLKKGEEILGMGTTKEKALKEIQEYTDSQINYSEDYQSAPDSSLVLIECSKAFYEVAFSNEFNLSAIDYVVVDNVMKLNKVDIQDVSKLAFSSKLRKALESVVVTNDTIYDDDEEQIVTLYFRGWFLIGIYLHENRSGWFIA